MAKKMKIEQIIQRAIIDYDFLQLLIKDTEKALSVTNITLTKKDEKTLKKMLSREKVINGSELLQIMNYSNKGLITRAWPTEGAWGAEEPHNNFEY